MPCMAKKLTLGFTEETGSDALMHLEGILRAGEAVSTLRKPKMLKMLLLVSFMNPEVIFFGHTGFPC